MTLIEFFDIHAWGIFLAVGAACALTILFAEYFH